MERRVGCQAGFSHTDAQIHLLVKGFIKRTLLNPVCILKCRTSLRACRLQYAGAQHSRVKVWLQKHLKHSFPAVIARLLLFCSMAARLHLTGSSCSKLGVRTCILGPLDWQQSRRKLQWVVLRKLKVKTWAYPFSLCQIAALFSSRTWPQCVLLSQSALRCVFLRRYK